MCIIVHDNCQTVQTETIRFRHHPFTEAISDVIGAHQRSHHDENVKGDDNECDGIPAREHKLLKLEIMLLASGQDTARITRLTNGSLYEWTEITTAVELVLDPQSPRSRDHSALILPSRLNVLRL